MGKKWFWMGPWCMRAMAFALALVLAGCSVVYSHVTPENPAERTPGQKCGGIQYPLYDTGYTMLGVGEVIVGHGMQQPDRVEVFPDQFIEVPPSKTEENLGKYLEIKGYAMLIAFGASAIYGYVAEGTCAARRPNMKRDRGRVTRPGFPRSIFGLHFDMSAADASRACTAGGQKWALAGAAGTTGYCRSEGLVAKPDVRVQFAFGVASEISVLYAAPPEQLTRHYDRLYAGVRDQFGAPQVERAPLARDCAASLAQCLSQGARPRGAAWHWPAGSIDLAPILDDGRAVIELKYARQERAAQ